MPILQVLSKHQLVAPALFYFIFLFICNARKSGHRALATPVPDSKSNPIQSIEFTMVAEKMVDGGKNISIRGYLLMAQQALEQRDNNGFSLRI